MRRVESSAKITVQKSLLHGVDLEQIVPSIGQSLAAQLQDLEILTTTDTHIAGARAHLLDYTATEDGEARRFKHALLKIDERLFSITCRADVSEFGEIEPKFDQILQSVSIENPVYSL